LTAKIGRGVKATYSKRNPVQVSVGKAVGEAGSVMQRRYSMCYVAFAAYGTVQYGLHALVQSLHRCTCMVHTVQCTYILYVLLFGVMTDDGERCLYVDAGRRTQLRMYARQNHPKVDFDFGATDTADHPSDTYIRPKVKNPRDERHFKETLLARIRRANQALLPLFLSILIQPSTTIKRISHTSEPRRK